jgi:hypothetical protein
MEPFGVIVTGVRHFHDYARLRDLLDRLLAHRLPDVVILSRCGRGTDSLATSYAVERALQLIPYPLNHARDRTDETAAARRNADLAADADAVVVVWDRVDRDLGDLLGRCRRKGIPVRVLVSGRPDESPADVADPDGGADHTERRGGPPD